MVQVRACAPLGKEGGQQRQSHDVKMAPRARRRRARWQNNFYHVKLHRFKVTDFCRSATDDLSDIPMCLSPEGRLAQIELCSRATARVGQYRAVANYEKGNEGKD